MRDEQGRKKEASQVKQARSNKQSNTAHPRQSLTQTHDTLDRALYIPLSYKGSSAGWALISSHSTPDDMYMYIIIIVMAFIKKICNAKRSEESYKNVIIIIVIIIILKRINHKNLYKYNIIIIIIIRMAVLPDVRAAQCCQGAAPACPRTPAHFMTSKLGLIAPNIFHVYTYFFLKNLFYDIIIIIIIIITL